MCVNNGESYTINDIVYNNESEYINNNIEYKTVKITKNDYLHYTKEDINYFIITKISIISGSGKEYLRGTNDNNHFLVNSLIEKNYFCKGSYITILGKRLIFLLNFFL